MKIINLWIKIWVKNDQISEKSKRHKQKQRQRNIHINSVVEFRIPKIRMLKHSENVYAPYYESNWNSFDCVEIEDIKVILRLWMKL